MYVGGIGQNLPTDVFLTSYADDSYVVLSDNSVESLIRRTEICLSTHIEHLEAIGMKVNESKTEIVLFGATEPSVLINVRGVAVELNFDWCGIIFTPEALRTRLKRAFFNY